MEAAIALAGFALRAELGQIPAPMGERLIEGLRALAADSAEDPIVQAGALTGVGVAELDVAYVEARATGSSCCNIIFRVNDGPRICAPAIPASCIWFEVADIDQVVAAMDGFLERLSR